MSILDGMFTGLVMGLIFSVPAFVTETLRHGRNLPLLLDVKTVWGRPISEEDVLEWSVFLHLALSTVYGGVYPFLVSLGALPSYSFLSIAFYSLAFYLVFGLALAPAIGIGILGRREGHLVWLELLLMDTLYAVGFWYAATRLFIQ